MISKRAEIVRYQVSMMLYLWLSCYWPSRSLLRNYQPALSASSTLFLLRHFRQASCPPFHLGYVSSWFLLISSKPVVGSYSDLLHSVPLSLRSKRLTLRPRETGAKIQIFLNSGFCFPERPVYNLKKELLDII